MLTYPLQVQTTAMMRRAGELRARRDQLRRQRADLLPLRALATCLGCLGSVPSSFLLLSCAVGWGAGIFVLQPGPVHRLAFTVIVLVFNASFVLTWKTPSGSLPRADAENAESCCEFCQLSRPAGGRSSHCASCDVCVLRRDHHCPSVGTCVGLGNHGWFVLMLASQIAVCGHYLLLLARYASAGDAEPSSLSMSVWLELLVWLLGLIALLDFSYVLRLLVANCNTNAKMFTENAE